MDIPVDSNTAIVFDLDDTLYNELDYLKSAYKELAERLEPDSSSQLFSEFFSRYRNKQNVFEHISEKYGLPIAELIGEYRNHIPNITPFNGVIELLKAIKSKGGKLGIITDGRSNTQRNKIKALKIDSLIDYVVVSGEIGSEKPSEENYRLIERELDCTVNYYIGDNIKKDFVTPNRIGWKTIGLIDNGLNIHSNAYMHLDDEHWPNDLVYAIKDLIIT